MALEDERQAKRKRYTSRIITLKVGAAKEEIKTYEDVLKDDSPFFKAALEKNWQEGKDGVIELPEDDMDIVTAYIHWLYSREICKIDDENKDPVYNFLAVLSVFGEKIQSTGFCNATAAAICAAIDKPDSKGSRHFPNSVAVQTIYSGTPNGAPVRQMLLEMYAERAQERWFTQQNYPHDFVLELLRRMISRRKTEPFKSFHDRKSNWEKK